MSDDPKSAKIEAKVAKAKAKALRPWYQKKRYWVLGAIVLIAVISSVAKGSKSGKSPTASAPTTIAASSATTEPASVATTTVPASVATTTVSTGSSLTQQQQSAVQSANEYLSTQAFSKQGLIDQLDSAAGSGYSVSDATVAVDSLTVNWNAEAVQAAKEYLQTQPFSCNNLINQLDSSASSQFTVAQATYGATKAGDC